VPDVTDAYRQALAVVEIIESAESASVPLERHRHAVASMAALSRCRSLLLGVVELDKAGRGDLLGVLLRALLEAWYFGVIALLGDESDLDRLEADHRYWKNALATAMPGVNADPGPSATFSVRQRAERADQLLTDIGEPRGIAIEWYQTMYAAESLTSTHAGFESLRPYLFEDVQGNLCIVHEPATDEGVRYGRVRTAAVLTALLAKWTWARVGLNANPFDEIVGLSDAS